MFRRIMSAYFTKNGSGKINIGKRIFINSDLEANQVDRYQTVFLFKNDDALIEIGNGTGIPNALIADYGHVYIGKNVSISTGGQK